MPDEPQPQDAKPKKPKTELPIEPTDLVVSQQVKLGTITVDVTPQGLERFIVDNDVSQLAGNAQTRALYYLEMCRRYEVDPFTKPFDWIPGSDGKGLVLYPNKEFAAQRRKKSGISCSVVAEGVMGPSNGQPGPEVYYVRMKGTVPAQNVPVEQLVGFLPLNPSREDLVAWGKSLVDMARKTAGREDEEIAAFPFTDAMGRPIDPGSKANAIKKAYTAAKRRLTLSLEGCGADDASRDYDTHDRDAGPTQPRVLQPPTRARQAQKALEAAPVAGGAPEGSQGPSEGIPEQVAAPATQATVAPQPQPAPKPAVQAVPSQPNVPQQPGPPAPPTPAPAVQVVGKRAVYIPR